MEGHQNCIFQPEQTGFDPVGKYSFGGLPIVGNQLHSDASD
jgi:hypothetical protein